VHPNRVNIRAGLLEADDREIAAFALWFWGYPPCGFACM
jgi:hypothetical protein